MTLTQLHNVQEVLGASSCKAVPTVAVSMSATHGFKALFSSTLMVLEP